MGCSSSTLLSSATRRLHATLVENSKVLKLPDEAATSPGNGSHPGCGLDVGLARNMAQRSIPFVPYRVVRKFLRLSLPAGKASDNNRGPNSKANIDGLGNDIVAGSMLVIDVSGFTRLSQFYGNKGSEGAEQFCLSISGFLARLTAIVLSFGGDVDAFAGDAALV
eukprot:scaffold128527_cov47-Prasinocladus_malaysianus.AAC.1